MTNKSHETSPAPGHRARHGFGGIRRVVRNYWQRLSASHALSLMYDHERKLLSEALGVAPAELAHELCAPPREAFLPLMMDRFGVDAAARLQARRTLRDMERVCAECTFSRRCARAVRRNAPTSAFRAFCPNAAGLDALTAAESR